MAKKVVGKSISTEELVKLAVQNDKVVAAVQDRPSSLELTKNRDGSYSWTIKIYCNNGELKGEGLKLVTEINKQLGAKYG